MATFMGDPRYRNRCDKCDESVGENTAEWSLNKYGAVFCWDCQPKTIEEVTKKWKNKEVNTARN